MEKTQRLQEIQAKLDPRAETRVRDGRVFKPVELLRRRLIHDGALLWKNAGSRLKGSLYFTLLLMDVHGWCEWIPKSEADLMCICEDVQVLLMTDILVILQEKDQRYVFPSLVRIGTYALNIS